MIIRTGAKIIILSLIFALIFHFGINYFTNVKALEKEITEVENKEENNVKSKNNIVAHIGTAVSLNLGIKHKMAESSDFSHIQDIFEIEYILSNNEVARNSLIKNNMLAINAYRSNLKLDIKNELNLSTDRARTLDFIINKFEYNLENARKNLETLQRQKVVLEKARSKAISDSYRIKSELESEFKAGNPTASLEYMEAYIEAKNRENYANTYIVFINEIIGKYQSLNTINIKLTQTLVQNKDPIIKGTTVVIPDSGTEFLMQLDLLFSEEKK